MTDKWKILLPMLLIFLLVGCGKTNDGLTIEGHDWTSTQAIDSTGDPIDLPALTCAAQDGSLSVMSADGNAQQSGTYSLAQRDANSAFMRSRSAARAARLSSASQNTRMKATNRKANIRSSSRSPIRQSTSARIWTTERIESRQEKSALSGGFFCKVNSLYPSCDLFVCERYHA